MPYHYSHYHKRVYRSYYNNRDNHDNDCIHNIDHEYSTTNCTPDYGKFNCSTNNSNISHNDSHTTTTVSHSTSVDSENVILSVSKIPRHPDWETTTRFIQLTSFFT
jgi:hypothetical protein